MKVQAGLQALANSLWTELKENSSSRIRSSFSNRDLGRPDWRMMLWSVPRRIVYRVGDLEFLIFKARSRPQPS